MSLSSPNVGSVDPSVDDSMLIRRVQQGLSAFELVYRPHPNWPCSPLMNNNTHNSHLLLAILDSSFNPPTRAHFALAVAPPPAPDSSRYDARLLLLSVRNADKHLKSSDATYEQRLRMMRLLAADMFDADELANAAVAVIDAPTFVAKASILQTAITSYLTDKASRPKLTFIQGMDTLERFLAARYYGSDNAMHDALAKFFSLDGDNAAIVCARRTMTSGGDVAPEDEAERLLLEAAKEYVAAGRLSIMGIGDALQSMSSSEVRAKLASGDSSWRDCVTQRISTYIEQEGLYRN